MRRAVLARSVCGLDLHSGGRHANAACREHALALDLHHTDAAIAVRAGSRASASSTDAAA